MPEFLSLTYGSSKIDLSIPSDFLAGPVIQPASRPPMTDEAMVVCIDEALAAPLGRPRLRERVTDRRVAVVVSDEFRAGLHSLIIDRLCEELRAGRPSKVTFLCATGTHDPKVYAPRIEAMVMKHAAGLPVEFVAHDCDDPRLAAIGTSPLGTPVALEPAFLRADVRVYGHEAKHHYMHGYSVVDKQVIPGIADRRSVEYNHKRSLDDDSGPGRNPWHDDPARRANPFSEDSRDIRAMAERLWIDDDGRLVEGRPDTFALDMISDPASIYWVGAGDPDEVSREALRKADEQAQFTVDRTRYAVVSPGGPPASQAMYGVQNCFDMAVRGAVQPGGEVLVLAPCEGRPDLPPDVSGVATSSRSRRLFWDNLIALRDEPLEACFDEIDENFELYMWKTYRVLRNFKGDRLKIHVHSQLAPERLVEAGFIPVADPQAWIDERAARGDGSLRAIDQGNKLLVVGR